jgi:spore germination protein YaaH
VTDTSVSLTWTAARLPAGSTLRGYRVMRDGVVVTQVPGEAVSVGNLAPKSAHDWTVAAVDGLGHVGEPSPATRIVQADPSPTAGAAQTYLLASTDSSFAAFRKHYRQIGVVYPTFFDCDRGTGQLLGSDNRQIVSFAQDRKVKVMPRFNCQSTTMLHRIFTEPALREQWLSGITALLDQHGYDGVNVDFEKAAPGDRNLVTGFMAELSDRVHARGKLLSQAVSAKTRDVPNHPRSTAFDYAELSKYNDWLFVMAWGQHWSTSAPGPQDDINWVRGVADYVASMPNKEKFVLGSLFYAMDWPANGGPANPGTALNAAELQALIDRTGAKPQFDAPSASWHLTYTDAAGVGHNVWWTDATAVGERMVIARERGLGVGFWRLGQEDERFWSDPRLSTIG